jgi:hypothetical protein
MTDTSKPAKPAGEGKSPLSGKQEFKGGADEKLHKMGETTHSAEQAGSREEKPKQP